LFVGPGKKLVLITPWQDAVFAWRHSVYRKDCQVGVECTIFRNESPHLSSAMILEAEVVARRQWPNDRLFTFVDPSAIAGSNPGYCFKMAGWKYCRDPHGNPARSANGKLILEKLPARPLLSREVPRDAAKLH
jgi:hypothetical protein